VTTAAPEALLGELLRDVSIAWRALSSYPSGHPSASAALERARGRFAALLGTYGPFELLAGRDALGWGERRLAGPTSTRLAELLRRRNAAAVEFTPGIDSGEIEFFLRGLLVDPRKARAAGSLARELEAAGVEHIRVRDLDFSGLSVVEGEDAPSLPEAGGLWEKLARRLVGSGQLPGETLAAWVAGGRRAVGLLAALLGRAPGLGPEDAAWTGAALAALAGHAAAAFAEEPTAERAQGVATLHAALPPELRSGLETALGRALGSRDKAEEALDELATALGPEVMVRVRAAAAEPAGVAESAEAAAGAASGEAGAAAAVRATGAAAGVAPPAVDLGPLQRLRRLFAGTDLDAVAAAADLETGAEVLLEVAVGPHQPVAAPQAATAYGARFAAQLAGAVLGRALAGALLELAERPELPPAALDGLVPRLEDVYLRLLAAGDLRRCLVLVERSARQAEAGGERAPAFRELLGRLAGRDAVAVLVAALAKLPEEGEETIKQLLARLGGGAAESLLDVLAESDDRATRRRLLDLLPALGGDVSAGAAARLADSRWYVVRNMLVLLRRLGDPGALAAVRRCADHPDIRVRLEAIRNLFAFDQELPRGLLRSALRDSDPRLADAAIELAGSRGIVEAVEPLVELLQERDLFGRRRGQRLLALKALGELAQPHALDGLSRYVARFTLLPVSAEERRELFRTLGDYPPEARRPFVERGLRMKDPEVRRLAAALARAPEGTP